MNFHIISLFPKSFDSYISESIVKRAIESKKINVSFYNPMDYAEKSKFGKLPRRIDDKPYSGGPGMVMRAEPVLKAIKSALGRKKNYKIVYFSPRGEEFNTAYAKKTAKQALVKTGKKITDIVLVCGRYEGIDSRVEEIYKGERISIGNYVLTGGELAAMVFMDSVSRQIPGVLGNERSLEEERVSAGKFYTRPEAIKHKSKTYKVPKVLLEGNHKEIEKWREENK